MSETKEKAIVLIARNRPSYNQSYVMLPEAHGLGLSDKGLWRILTPYYGETEKTLLRAGMVPLKPGGGPVAYELILKPIKKKRNRK